jgi:hypothetical protein
MTHTIKAGIITADEKGVGIDWILPNKQTELEEDVDELL